MRLQIITPEKKQVDEDVDMVVVRCKSGDMGILPGHTPCSALLDDCGVMRIMSDGIEYQLALFGGGILQMKDDVLTVLPNGALWPEEIDRTHAECDKEAAEQYLNAEHDYTQEAQEIKQNQALLRCSSVMIEVSSYSPADKKGK